MAPIERIEWLKKQLQALKSEAETLPFQYAREHGLHDEIRKLEAELRAEESKDQPTGNRIILPSSAS